MRFNLGLIRGLWAARNRETDTPEQRATLRAWLRQSVRVERQYRQQYL
jgi:hypothetical protein